MKFTTILRILALILSLAFVYLRLTHTWPDYSLVVLGGVVLAIIAARVIDYMNRKNDGPTSTPPSPEN